MRGVVTPCGLRLASVVNYGKQNRQREQQKVTHSTAPVVPRGSRSASVVNYNENRQCRQRLVKRRTGEARTVWAAIRRYCQFQKCDEAVEGFIKIRGKIYQFNSRSELENLLK